MKNKKQLSAWERDKLKYRSYQIMLYLFHVEELKRFIVRSLQFTNSVVGSSKKKMKFDDYLTQIVSDEIITEGEKEELISLIDFRNDISHEIHKIVDDLGTAEDSDGISPHDREGNYQYGALIKIKILSEKIYKGFQGKYVMSLSMNRQAFEPVERALEYESKKLFKKMLHHTFDKKAP